MKCLQILFLFFLLPFISFSQMASIELEDKAVPTPMTRDMDVERFNQSQLKYYQLSADAKEFYYWVNYSRRNPKGFWDSVAKPIIDAFPTLNVAEARSLKVDLYKANGLSMFSLNDTLIRLARLHANDISVNKARPSHTSTNGTDFGSRMNKAGIYNCAGENISISGQGVLMAVLLLYLDINLPDLGHRKTLLDPLLVETGIGIAKYGKEHLFIVQDFACLQ